MAVSSGISQKLYLTISAALPFSHVPSVPFSCIHFRGPFYYMQLASLALLKWVCSHRQYFDIVNLNVFESKLNKSNFV